MPANVSGTYLDADGEPERGTIKFVLEPAAVDSQGGQRTTNTVEVALDGTGSFLVTLVTAAELTNVEGNAVYRVMERIGGWARSWYLHLADSTPVNLPERYPGDAYSNVAVLPVPGEMGVGVPMGGLTGQYLFKTGPEDYAMGWTDPPGEDIPFQWSNSTSGDPGTGYMAIDQLGLENGTELRISATDPNGDPIADIAALISAGDLVTVSAHSGPNATYEVTGTPTDNTTYYSIPITFQRGSGGLPQADEAMATKWDISTPHTHAEYLELTGGTMSGTLTMDDGNIDVDHGWINAQAGNNGGLLVWGGFEVYHETATMPNRSIGFWRNNQPLLAAEDYEPVTRKYLKDELKAIAAASTDFADFQARIAAW